MSFGERFVTSRLAKLEGGKSGEVEQVLKDYLGDANKTFAGVGTVSAEHRQRKPDRVANCTSCSREIIGRVIETGTEFYHPHCFCCSQCDRPMELTGSSFVVRQNKPWCSKCLEWEKKLVGTSSKAASAAPATTTTVTKSGDDEATRRELMKAHDKIQEGKVFCGACEKAISGVGVHTPYGYPLCDTCFICGTCYDIIGTGAFVNIDNVPYHPHCAPKTDTNSCAKCGERVDGRFVKFEGKSYHKPCFTCHGCSTPLEGGYMLKQGKPHCSACGSAPVKATTSSVTVTASSASKGVAGLRFDHKSGKAMTATAPTPAAASSSVVFGRQMPAATATTAAAPAAAASSGAASSSAGGGGRPKFCGECGTPTPATGKFCGECGKPF